MRSMSKFDHNQNFLILSFHQENTCGTSLHLNLIILTDFYNFIVNGEKTSELVNLNISAKVRVCDFGQNL